AITPEDTPVVINLLGNDTDADGEPLTVSQINGQPVTVGTPVTLLDNVGNTIGTVTLNPDQTVTFDPAPGYNGPVDFTYTVTDGTSSDTANVRIVVDDVNDPPVAQDNTITGFEDSPVTFDPRSNDSDPDGDPLTITAINGQPISPGTTITLPEGTVSMNNDGSLSFSPNKDFNGPVAFDYTVDDGRGGTDTATVNLQITPVDDASVLAPDTKTVAEDTVATGNVLTNDSDIDNTLSVASFSVAGLPGTFAAGTTATIAGVGTLLLNADGGYTFTPVADYNGTVPQVSYTTNTGSNSTLDINVTPLDDTPAASDDLATTPEDTPVTIDVLANDTDADTPTLTITAINGQPISVGSPVQLLDTAGLPQGTVSLTPDGKLVYTPAPNTTGPVDFNYTVTDGLTPVQAKVHVDVTPVNDAPVATDDTVTVAEDTPVTLNVLGNDTDVEGDPLTITQIDGQPVTVGTPVVVANGTVTVNPNGTVTFDPAP
ncbi:MAG: hypothetical protein CFE40_14810, partial [Burkholderiales bacterium PBB1]